MGPTERLDEWDIERSLRHERDIEPSHFDTLAETLRPIHLRLAEITILRAGLQTEWDDLQLKQQRIIDAQSQNT